MDRLHELAAKAAAFADLLDHNRPLFSDGEREISGGQVQDSACGLG